MSLDRLLSALDLKEEARTGWGLRGVTDPESVADHSWSTALLTLLHADDADVDTERAVAMALIHDLPEARTGDLLPGTEGKEERERAALDTLLPERDLRELWEEYAARDTAEARFVKDMDLCDTCLQALKYRDEARNAAPLDEFFATSEPKLSTDTGKRLFRSVRDRYRDE